MRWLRIAVVLVLCVSCVAAQPAPKSIFVLSGDKLLQYDAKSFKLQRTIALPPGAGQDPERISISSSGEITVLSARNENAEANYTGGDPTWNVWWSDAFPGAPTVIGSFESKPAAGGGRLVTIDERSLAFDAMDPQRLYWFANRQVQSVGTDHIPLGRDLSVEVWTTDRKGQAREDVAEVPFEKCACETGACRETCPEGSWWTQPDGVSDFFFMSHVVYGQLETDVTGTDLFQRNGDKWTSRQTAAPYEQILDAVDHGNLVVTTIPDGACCGWENEDSDRTEVWNGDQRSVIFDEFKRYANADYDVSFYTSNARFSPDRKRVAFTVSTTMQPGMEWRVSDQGKPNENELQRLKEIVRLMPRAEVYTLDPVAMQISIGNTEFIGWLDDQQILSLRKGELVVTHLPLGEDLETHIKADKAQGVWLR